MSAALRHRGRGGTTSAVANHAALGQVLLGATAGGIFDDADGLIISFDGRVDNRVELAALIAAPDRRLGDAALVLSAYRRWGASCVSHLLGDFAFAIWDPGKGELFCARDPFGVRPFYYQLSEARFLFASEVQGLLAADPKLAERVSRVWIGEFLAGCPPGIESTLYEDVRRLPPGHSCTLSQSGFELRRYYDLKLSDEVRRADAPEQFASLFEEAVTCRMAGDRPVAAMLSGGLDSSSIVGIAAAHQLSRGAPLHTYSMVYPATPTFDERAYIDDVVQLHQVVPHYLDCNDIGPFDELERLLRIQNGPLNAPNQAAMEKLVELVGSDGYEILLDGHGGDETVSNGDARVCDLAFNGQWVGLWRELERFCARRGRTDTFSLFRKVIRRYGPHRRLRPAAAMARKFLKRVPDPVPGVRYVSDRLAREIDLAERCAKHVPKAPLGHEERHSHHANIQSPAQSYGFEGLDRMGAAVGVELRFPFWDRRLVEFCISLPSDEKLRDGHTRAILRRALGPRLPARVRDRTDKLNFKPHLVRGMLKDGGTALKQLLDDPSGRLATYANLDVLRSAFADLQESPTEISGPDVQALWRAAALATWLEMSA